MCVGGREGGGVTMPELIYSSALAFMGFKSKCLSKCLTISGFISRFGLLDILTNSICDRAQENWAQNRPHQKKLHLHQCWHRDIKLSKYYNYNFKCCLIWFKLCPIFLCMVTYIGAFK